MKHSECTQGNASSSTSDGASVNSNNCNSTNSDAGTSVRANANASTGELTALLTSAFLIFGFNNAQTSAMPELVLSLGGSAFLAGTQNSLFVLAAVVLRFVLGPLADRYGSKFLLIIGAAGFCLPCAFIPLCSNAYTVTALRILQAVGLAAYHPNVANYIAAHSSASNTAKRIGLSRFASTLSLMVMPAALFPLIGSFGHGVFFTALAFAAFAGLLLVLPLKKDHTTQRMFHVKHSLAPNEPAEVPEGNHSHNPKCPNEHESASGSAPAPAALASALATTTRTSESAAQMFHVKHSFAPNEPASSFGSDTFERPDASTPPTPPAPAHSAAPDTECAPVLAASTSAPTRVFHVKHSDAHACGDASDEIAEPTSAEPTSAPAAPAHEHRSTSDTSPHGSAADAPSHSTTNAARASRPSPPRTPLLPRVPRELYGVVGMPFLLAFAYSIMLVFGPLLAKETLPTMNAGLLFTFVSVGGLAGTLTTSRMDSRWNAQRMLSAMCVIFAGGMIALPASSVGMAAAFASCLAIGFGYFGATAMLIAELGTRASRATSGSLFAAQQNCLDLGVVAGSFAAGALVETGMPLSFAFACAGGVLLVCQGARLIRYNRRKRRV